MINSSSALPQLSDFICGFCNSTTYVYYKFNNYPTNDINEAINVENDMETSQSSDNQENPQILPNTFESAKSFNQPEINTSEVASVNSKKRFSASSNKKQPKMYRADKPLKTSTNDINFADCSKKLDVPKSRVKRKLFGTVNPEVLPKKAALKSKFGTDETYKFLPGLSDSIADNFLSQFDREIASGSVDKLESHRNVPKRRAEQRQRQAVPVLKEETFSPSDDSNCNADVEFDINRSDLTATSDESSNTDQTESTEKNASEDIQKKLSNFLIRSNSRRSVSSNTDSISTTASSVSRYGRIRKPSSVYVNAAMFKGSVKKSAEIKQKASTVINSHERKNNLSRSIEATARYCPDQFDILTQTHKRMVAPQFKKSANRITPSKKRETTGKFQNNSRNSSWRNSSFIEQIPKQKKIPRLDKPTRQIAQSALIGDYSKVVVCSQCKQTPTLNRDLSSEGDIFKTPLTTNTFRSNQAFKNNVAVPKSQEIVIDNYGREFDPNEIHAVVKDEVVSFKWYSAKPDFESVFGNGTNVYYSMCDLKSFYTNMTVGYLKIDAGHEKPMTVLKNYILLYSVEKGEGIFQVSGRKVTGQIGATVFVPLGVEYSITNSNTEDLILKFVIISPMI